MRKIFSLAGIALLAGCAANTTDPEDPKVYGVDSSYLEGENKVETQSGQIGDAVENTETRKFRRLASIKQNASDKASRQAVSRQFSDTDMVQMAAEEMPLSEFLHYVFGELLETNYVLNQDVKNLSLPITLNVQESISKRRLFALAAELLTQNQISIDFNEEVFFIQRAELGKAKAIIGLGRKPGSVPNTSGQILQVVPVEYGIKVSMERTVKDLIDATIRADFEQSALFVLGDRANVLRALELINMLDVPANKGKHIGLISLTYSSVENFIGQASVLLTNEGIPSGIDAERNRSVNFVPLPNIGAVAVFANSQKILARVRYWVTVLDQPARGDQTRYFVYSPKYARATDMGESIGQLLSLGRQPANRAVSSQASTGQNAEALQAESVDAQQVVSGDNVSFVVDERSNSIIFSTTGSQYKILEPLLEKLDVLPKQVILEVMIAEVRLTGDFRYGVEFALNQDSSFTTSTLGAFGAATAGGINLTYVDGDSSVIASFFKQNRYTNILSNPTLLVRDGVQASISVGSDIPVQGGTVSDDGVTSVNFQYRRTGIELSVTPTINAQGVVIMNIDQQVSNTLDEIGVGGNPSVFERSLKTEAVVESGQTVILGGLISENSNNANTKVPLLGDIPVLGSLFRGKNDSSEKTELVMLVTPKVIYNGDQWEKLIQDFQSGLKNIRIQN